MLTTIVTPINFNRFAKRLKKILHENSIELSLSSAQDILSKTLGFKNQFELKTQFTDPNIHFVEINELKYQYFLYRFASFLECNAEKSRMIFDDTFSLFKERRSSVIDIRNSIISIIKKITDIAKHDNLIQKFLITYGYEQLKFLVKKSNDYDSSNENENTIDLAIKKAESYPHLKLFWAGSLRYNVKIFPQTPHLNEYFMLLDQLLSHSVDDIISVFNTNEDIFIHTNKLAYFVKFEHEKIIFLDKKMYEKNYYLLRVSDTDKSQYETKSLNPEYVIIPNEVLEKTLNNTIIETISFDGNKNCIKKMHDDTLQKLMSRANLIKNLNDFRIAEVHSIFDFLKNRNYNYLNGKENLLGNVYTIEEANKKLNKGN